LQAAENRLVDPRCSTSFWKKDAISAFTMSATISISTIETPPTSSLVRTGQSFPTMLRRESVSGVAILN